MRSVAISLIRLVDHTFSRVYHNLFQERNSLLALLFHGLFNDMGEAGLNYVNPQQSITVEQFRHIVEYYLERGYEFVTPADILKGLDGEKKFVLITFDDGYFSSKLALPVLKEYKAPANFFISISHVLQNKCFWWDVLWRERKKTGMAEAEIHREVEQLKTNTNDDIEKYLIEEFGASSLEPVCDVDRPLTVSEFQALAREELVDIGNHTMDHAILTNYPPGEAKSQIADAQNAVFEHTGAKPVVIAYPNGNYSDEIIRTARAADLKLGITIEPHKNYLPLDLAGNGCMCLGRFIPLGNRKLKPQLDMTGSDVTIKRLLNRWR